MNRYIFSIIVYLMIGISFPTKASIPASKLYHSPSASHLSISPDSQYIGLFRRDSKSAYIELIDIKSFKRFNVFTFNSPSWFDDYSWIDSNTLYIEYHDSDKKEQKAFLEISFKDKKLEAKLTNILTKGNVLNTLPNIDDKVLFAKKSGDDLDDIEVYTATTKEILSNKFRKAKAFGHELDNAFVYVSDNNGNIKMAATYEDDTFYYWVYDNKLEEWYKVHKIFNQDYEFSPIGVFRNGNLAVLTNKESDLVSLYEFNVKTKAFVKLIYQHRTYDLTAASFNSNTDSVEAVRYIDHGKITTEYLTDSKKDLFAKIKQQFPDKQVVTSSRNEKSGIMIVNLFASDDPGSYFLFNSHNLKTKFVANEYDKLIDVEFTKSIPIATSTADGETIEAILTRPKLNNSVLIVNPHGGPVGVRDYDLFSPNTQYFASRGFSILQVNFRGSEGFGKEFRDAGRGQFGKKIEEDISIVVDKVLSQYQFSKICTMGSSYGGYSAMMLGIYNPEKYNCIVAAYGVYDLQLLFNASNTKTHEKYKNKISFIVGNEDDDLSLYSPFNLAEKVTQPVLLIAGKDDPVSGFEQSNRMKYRLNKLSKNVETMFYDGVGHGHNTWRGQRHENAYIYYFLRKTLGLTDGDSEKGDSALEEENMLLSDSFSFKDFVEDDPEKAIYFLRLAANNGNSRAMFNLGSFYHRGEVVEKNLSTAIAWYVRASEKGFSDASFRLGELYKAGMDVTKDLEKSFKYFEKSLKQGEAKASFELAEAYCLGMGVEKNYPLCFKQFDSVDLVKNKVQLKVLKILDRSFWNAPLAANEVDAVKRGLDKLFQINTIDGISVSPTEEGVFRRSWRGAKLKDSTLDVPLDFGVIFGIKYKINFGVLSEKPRALVKVRWSLPKSKDLNSTEEVLEKKYIVYLELNEEAEALYTLRQQSDLREGEWKLEIFSIKDELLFSKTFNTKLDN